MLDGGPSRVPRAGNQPNYRRSTSNQPANIERPAIEPVPSSRAPQPEPRSAGRFKKTIITLAVVLSLAALGWLAWTNLFGGVSSTIDSSKNQALFLSSGQAYFGKLEIVNDQFMRLSQVFYIQSDASEGEADSDNPQQSSTNDMQLIKLGEEVHGPEDAMIINRDQVLFFENLKDDSQISELIKQYNQKD